MDESAHLKSERDLAFAAYYLQHGVELVRARVTRITSRGKQYEFLFRDPSSRIAELQVQFANSPEARFDAAMRTLKKLCTGNGRRP